ncbi:Protocadherin gamma-A4 [Armadillidium nasatum]|uniref:Protocadherin gamma-A4 n=1 Tax=Armadillidium nasatum TaxID=96803 RepID=A0A5N5SZT0_9CRUS|nr:Protocadherin gamma-A4 [Armadillidium nasatum]
MSGTLQLRESLDYETDPIFNITIVAEDRGNPPKRTETFVTVQVIDSDDQNPAFGRQRYMAFLPPNPVKGRILEIQPEQIYAADQDNGIRAPIFYTLGKDVFEASYLNIDPENGEVSIVKDIPEDQFLQPVALSVMVGGGFRPPPTLPYAPERCSPI